MSKRFHVPMLDVIMAKHKWLITGVPGLALYTVGLIDEFDHPELAIHGMGPDQSDSILRSAFVEIEKGLRMEPDSEYERVIKNFRVRTLIVDPSNFHDWFGQAHSYHGPELKMLQLLWPDREGKFPGNPLYDPKFSMQLRFDVRRPEYWSAQEHKHTGHDCAVCGGVI